LDAVEPAFASHVEAGYEAQLDEAPEDGAVKVYSAVRESFAHLTLLKALRKEDMPSWIVHCHSNGKFQCHTKQNRSKTARIVRQNLKTDVTQIRQVVSA
jgi:hypothetical protein